MALVSQLVVEIAAKAEKVKEGLSAAMQHVMNFANGAANLIGKAFSGVGGIISSIIKDAFDQMGDAQDRLTKLISRSNYLSVPVKDIQALDYAVNKAGGGIGSMDVAVRTMSKNLSQAVSGAGPAAQAIKDLGLNAGLLAKMNLTQQLGTIQVAIGKLKDQSKGKGILYQLFGESILPNIAIFNKALGDQFNAFEKLGTGIDSSQEKIIRMNVVARATFNELKEGFINQFTIPFLDLMTQVIGGVQSFIEKAGGVKPAALTLAEGVLSIFNSVEHGLSGVTGVILQLQRALTEALIKYEQFKSGGEIIGQKIAKSIAQTKNVFTSGILLPGHNSDAFNKQQKIIEEADTIPQSVQNIIQLEKNLANVNKALAENAKGYKGLSDGPLQKVRDQLANLTGPFASYNKALSDGISELSNITRYTQNVSDAQMEAANATDNLAAAMKKAADKAMNWLQDPSSHMGNTMKQLLNNRDKEAQANEIEIPEYMKKASLELYDKISELQAGDYQGEILQSLHNLQLDIINERQKGGYGTRNNQASLGKDLSEFLKQKNLAFTKVKVDVNLDMTDEMKKIIKVNGVYTTQDTIDNMMTLKSQNAVNLGLAAAAAAAGT